MVVSFQGGLPSWWSPIRVVFHHGGLPSGWSLIRVVSHQGGLPSGWSSIWVVSHQSGLPYGWSLIRVVSYQGGLPQGYSLIWVVFHQGFHRILLPFTWTRSAKSPLLSVAPARVDTSRRARATSRSARSVCATRVASAASCCRVPLLAAPTR